MCYCFESSSLILRCVLLSHHHSLCSLQGGSILGSLEVRSGEGMTSLFGHGFYIPLWRTFAVFLGFIVDRTHDYLTKLDGLTSTQEEVERLQKEKLQLTEKEEKSSKEIKQLQEKVATLSEDLKKLKLECAEKDKAVETAESHVTSSLDA